MVVKFFVETEILLAAGIEVFRQNGPAFVLPLSGQKHPTIPDGWKVHVQDDAGRQAFFENSVRQDGCELSSRFEIHRVAVLERNGNAGYTL